MKDNFSNSNFLQNILGRLPKELVYVTSVWKSLFVHYADIVKDIFLLLTLGNYLKSGSFFFKWVCASKRLKNDNSHHMYF